MQAMAYIRRVVFQQTQAAFAQTAGVAQATVSRWETGELNPTRDQLIKIRNSALLLALDWSDTWFFEPPDDLVTRRDPALEIAFEAAGSALKLSKALGISAQAISQWRRVPPTRVLEVERISGVPRHLLRPDLYPRESEHAR